MPVSLSIKNVPDELAEALRERAKRNHRSVQGELMAILEGAAHAARTAPERVRETAPDWEMPHAPRRAAWSPAGLPEGTPRIEVPQVQIAQFCRKWRIKELSLFGSVLRDDFGPDSDVDVLVRFEPDDPWSLFDLARMQNELETVFRRRVDLVDREAIEQSRNWIRRRHILKSQRVIYAA